MAYSFSLINNAPETATLPSPGSALLRSPQDPASTMASIQQLVGRWCLVESKGSQECRRELGWEQRWKWAPWPCQTAFTSDGKNLTIKTKSTVKITQFSCNL